MRALGVGMCGCVLAAIWCGLVDIYPVMITSFVILGLAILTSLILKAGKQSAVKFRVVMTVLKFSNALMAALLFILITNWAFDRSPARQFETIVGSKTISHGRGTTYYVVVSPSWRAGRDEERLRVDGSTFGSVREGEPVIVTVHKGFFGLSWYGGVAPR